MTTAAIPVEVGELTSDWFSLVLARDVTDATVLDQSSGTTGRARVALRGDATVPASVFVKLAPSDERQRALLDTTGMGVSEARFYRDLAREVPVLVPGTWCAATDDDRYVMVLEDLVATGTLSPAERHRHRRTRTGHRRATGGAAHTVLAISPIRS